MLPKETPSETLSWGDKIIESLVEGIITLDENGRVSFFNGGAERLSGWTRTEAIGQSINSIFQIAEGEDPILDHLPSNGVRHRLRVITKDGAEMTLSISAVLVKPPDSEKAQSVLVLRDITEEEDFRRLRSYFLANISHEFRTPLSALNASVELMLEEIESLSLSEMIELLDSIHYSVTNLQTLIDNLLESASIEAGHFRVRRRPVNLVQIASDAALMMQPLLNRRGQKLILFEAGDLPLVAADPTRLTQVLVNLLSNASKFSPLGERIELALERDGQDWLRFSIYDRGPGIPMEEQANVFRRFVRLGNGEAWYGVGLGLSVVKAIVEEHGGQVGVQDRPDGGSIFWFTIPLEGEGR